MIGMRRLGVHAEAEGQETKPLIPCLIFLKVQTHHKERVHEYNLIPFYVAASR